MKSKTQPSTESRGGLNGPEGESAERRLAEVASERVGQELIFFCY